MISGATGRAILLGYLVQAAVAPLGFMSSAKRQSRCSGQAPMFDSLFGLDDRADEPRKVSRDRGLQPQPAQQKSTSKKPKGRGKGQQVERGTRAASCEAQGGQAW